jgi:hypothetical protein
MDRDPRLGDSNLTLDLEPTLELQIIKKVSQHLYEIPLAVTF